jgi:Cys-rich repeat protein
VRSASPRWRMLRVGSGLGLTAAMLGASGGPTGCELYEGRSLDLLEGLPPSSVCEAASDCPRERALCIGGACVACANDAECSGGRPACVGGTCVECRSAAECEARQDCNTASNVCAQRCLEPSDCAGLAAVICDSELGLCVECQGDVDCAEPRAPACDRGGRCVECTSPEHCGDDKPACDVSARRCVECLDDSGCADGVCDLREHRCVECRSDEHCPAGSCDVASRRCRVPCASPGDCDPMRPLCEPETGLCVQCSAEANCTDPKKPACNADARCVECTTDAQCALAGKPVCVLSIERCGECTRPEHCPSGSCELETARCLPAPAP